MEFRIAKYVILIIKEGKREIAKRIKLRNQKISEHMEKKKIINIWEYQKRKPSNKRQWKKK